MSRTAVRKGKDAGQEQRQLEELGIIVQAESRNGLLEKLPEGLQKRRRSDRSRAQVARLRPMGVIKG
jgi:hypothetical protein